MSRAVPKIFVTTSLVIIAIVFALIVFTQTPAFRQMVQSSIYTLVKDNPDVSIHLGEIRGNLFTGMSIDTLAVYVRGFPLFESREVTISYDPLKLLKKHAAIGGLTINDPKIFLCRFSDGHWNIEYLTSASADTQPSPWRVSAKNFRIYNAQLRIVDSTCVGSPVERDSLGIPRINYADIDLRDLTLEMSGDVASAEQTISLHHLSCNSPREHFALRSLSASIQHTPKYAEVKNLLIETGKSHVEVSASMSGCDIFAIPSLSAMEHLPVSLVLRSSKIESNEIQKFLPVLYFLNGPVGLELNAEGEFGNFSITRLNAVFGKSILKLRGTMSNLHRPKDLTMNIISENSRIVPKDPRSLLPFYHIPVYHGLEVIDLDFHYVGKPLDYQVSLEAKTSAGIFSVDGAMNINATPIQYSAKIEGRAVDVAKFFSRPPLKSHLNFVGTIEGEGFTLEELNTTATLTVDSSQFQTLRFPKAQTRMIAQGGEISSMIDVRSSAGNLTAESRLTIDSANTPFYHFNAHLQHLDLAAIFRDDQYFSDITADFKTDGQGFTLEDMNATASLEFQRSMFGINIFDSVRADLRIAADSGGVKHVKLTSPIADLSLDGVFTYAPVITALQHQIQGIQHLYDRQRAEFDSSFAYVRNHKDSLYLGESSEPGPASHHQLKVEIQSKNLVPVAKFFGMPTFNALGTLQGSLELIGDTLSATGSVSIKSGRFEREQAPLGIDNLSASFNLNRMTPDSILTGEKGTNLDFRFAADHLYFGGTQIRRPVIEYVFRNHRGDLSAQVAVDTTIRAGIDAQIQYMDREFLISLVHCSARYNAYELNNTYPISLHLSSAGFSLDSASFTRGQDRLQLSGILGFDERIQAMITITEFPLQNTHHFGKSLDFKRSAYAFGGTVQATLKIDGTLESPTILMTASGNDVAYKEKKFGTFAGMARYENLMTDVVLKLIPSIVTDSSQGLSVIGTIPMNLTFGAADHRFDLPGMEVAVSAKDFDLSIIDAFVDQLDDMRGSLSSTVMCTGSLNHPLFNGTVDLRSGEFLFAMNAMTYRSDCSVVFHDSVLTLTGATIKNLDDDYANGKVDLTGSILFQGFLPTEYHLGLMGTLMVMSKTVRVPDQSYYGNLVVATGPEGLHFDGGYVKSLITGNLLLKESMLTFPPTRQTASLLSSRFLKIAVVDDTSKPAVVDSMASSLLVEFVGAKAQQAVDESSFLDGLIYDLGIQTDGVIQIRMVFNQATNEELFADLKGRLRLAKTGDAVNLTGSIDVSERSSYTFYKKFDAQGSLTFTGKPDNPQLDIAATYQSTHLKAQTDTTQAPVSEKVYVTLTIGGTRYEPKVKLGLTVKDESGVEIERTGDVEGDAISFLLTSSPGSPGKFRDDLTSNDKQSIATQLGGPIGAALVSGYANTLLSGIMLDFLRANNITFVSNAEVRYVGASPDLRLSGELLNAYWSFGGRVFNDINNANISLQMPLGAIVGNEELKNFMVELERRTEPVETVDTRRASVTGARIYYRIIF